MFPYRAWRLYRIHPSTTKEQPSWLSSSSPTTANASDCQGILPTSSKSPSKPKSPTHPNWLQKPERLYGSLQAAVDAQIQQVGFVPDEHYGTQATQRPVPGASCSQTTPASSVRQTPPAGAPETSVATVPAWKCSEKQQSLILELAGKVGLDGTALNELATRRFNKVVAMLNRMEASGLIDELMNRSGATSKRSASGRNNYTRRPATTYAGNSNPY